MERIKERLKGIARDSLLDIIALVIEISNTEVNIGEMQKQHGFSGGRVIELDVTDVTLRNVKLQAFFKVDQGVLKVVKNPKIIDDEIRIWERALIWAIIGKRPDTNTSWTLFDAWLQGKVKFYSTYGGTPRALQFMNSIWVSAKDAPSFSKLKPLLEKLT